MNDFLDDPGIKCSKHIKQFDPDHCGECATLALVDERLQLLTDVNNAADANDVKKLLELNKKFERLAIIDALFEKHEE